MRPLQDARPLVSEIAEEHPEIRVGKVNVDEEPELAASYRVMSIPTLVVMKNGRVTNTSVGVKPKARILAML